MDVRKLSTRDLLGAVDVADRAASLEAALRRLIEAGSSMPRATPKEGAACTVHDFQISAGAVWTFDLAMKDAERALSKRG